MRGNHFILRVGCSLLAFSATLAQVTVSANELGSPPAAPLLPPSRSTQATPVPVPQPGPWKILFDGQTVTGLRGLQKPDFLKAGWKVEKGALLLSKEIKDGGRQTGGDLVTTESFVDFEFVFEWRSSVSGTSGVLYFARGKVGGRPSGHEYQIIDDMRHPDGLKGGPLRRTAALYGILQPAENKVLGDAGVWNEGRIVVRGTHVEHWLNGGKALEYELGSAAFMQAVRASGAKVAPNFGVKFRTSIVLLDEGDEVAFRNLKVRAVPALAGRKPHPGRK